MEQTDTGLIVPEGTITQRREVWVRDDVKVMRRAMAIMESFNVESILLCKPCRMAKRDPRITVTRDPQTNEVVLTCHCAERRWENGTWRPRR